MEIFEWVIALLLGAALLAAWAQKLGAPYPTFLAIGGVLLAFIPGSPNWALDPPEFLGHDVTLSGFLTKRRKPMTG